MNFVGLKLKWRALHPSISFGNHLLQILIDKDRLIGTDFRSNVHRICKCVKIETYEKPKEDMLHDLSADIGINAVATNPFPARVARFSSRLG
jgi:hypothetical protein